MGPSKLVLILGCPRSGTTFLVEALTALDGIDGVSGRIVPGQLAHLAAQDLGADVRRALAYTVRAAIARRRQRLNVSRSETVAAWLRGEIGVGELLRGLSGSREVRGIVYKEPLWAFAPAFVMDALPGARVIHIHRDGRDAADSLQRTYGVLTDEKLEDLEQMEQVFGRRCRKRYVPWWVGHGDEETFLRVTPYLRSVWMWREMIRRCQTVLPSPEDQHRKRLLQVRYEALVRRPDEEGRRVLDFLGESMNVRVRARLRTAHARSIGIHRRRDPEEIEAATRLAHAELQELGYLGH